MKCKKVFYAIWFLAIFLFDRITKHMALGMLKTYVVTPFLSFQLVFNRGISWGMFHSDRQSFFVALTVCIAAIIAGLAYHTYQRYISGRSVYAECAVLAGALSNVVDRILYKGVIDFVHVHIDTWSWPIFNIADAAIVMGICWMIKEYYKEL
jgi:signal peptidase II